MKYTVSVNENSKVITVTLADGTVGTAKCCDTDHFNLTTGIELALERAKVAKAKAEKPKVVKSGDVMELVKALEKALPKGQMIVVGNGEGLTEAQKAWLHSLTDCKGDCSCEYPCDKDCEECDEYAYTQEEYDDAVEEAYDEGYADGERQANADHEQSVSEAYDEGYADALREVKSAIADLD